MALPFFELATASLILFVLSHIIKNYASPLSKIPNAGFGAAFSRLIWAFPREYSGTLTLELPKLHDKLGPLIRIGPNEVSFYSRETYETVHKVGSRDPKEHAKRRRIMAQLFSRSKVPNIEKLISSHVERLVNKLQHEVLHINLCTAARALEADIMSEFSFGTSIRAIDCWASGKQLAMVEKNDEMATWMPMVCHAMTPYLTNFPLLCTLWEQLEQHLFHLTGFRTQYTKGLAEFKQWCRRSWQSVLSADPEGITGDLGSPNLIETLCNAGLPAETALSEASENLGPGTDTTSGTLAHILWALAHNPAYQDALYRDLEAVNFSSDMTTLEGVARLQACVKEGIRWAATAAAMLPRIVPPGGIELHGKFIPEGTILTSSPIWYLHDKTAYPDPELYDPFRWLTEDAKDLSQDSLRDRFYIPFSRGANICLGAHFAYLELYISISQIVRNFRLKPSNPTQVVKHEEWNLVPLPKRREWVAAVPVDNLGVITHPRHRRATSTEVIS
ncbi:cytochrome P450 [Fusarium tricinctum]|uniref:Cytochrome P450 n=1 Tax=Fusarium tricinctum TaxID=61284 RepID=A0A8K0WG17_9HYPO|nr:cytochrome P450 [Fusarium tricinctum]